VVEQLRVLVLGICYMSLLKFCDEKPGARHGLVTRPYSIQIWVCHCSSIQTHFVKSFPYYLKFIPSVSLLFISVSYLTELFTMIHKI